MRFFGLALVLVSALSVFADMRKVTKTTVNRREWVETDSVQGDKRRTDMASEGSERATILIANQAVYELDLKSRQYVEHNLVDRAVARQPKPVSTGKSELSRNVAQPPYPVSAGKLESSGKTVDVYYEAVNTGEKREFFGKTAEHLILRERWVPEPGACEEPKTRERGGWYVLNPETKPSLGHFVTGLVVRAGKPCFDRHVFHGRFPQIALTVEETEGPMKTEITELSEAPLNPSVFEVPSGFTRVDALPEPPVSWEQQLRLEWYALMRVIGSWF
jgi:hypothetical protein